MRASDYFLATLPIIAASIAQIGSLWRPATAWPYGGLVVAIFAVVAGLVTIVDVVPASGVVRAIGSPVSLAIRSELALIVLLFSAAIAVAWLATLVHLQQTGRRKQVIRSTRTQHGDARFTRWSEVKHMADQPGFILGEWTKSSQNLAAELGADANADRGRDGQILRWAGAGSMLSFSPPGGGKTSSIVIPTLIDYPGPVVVNDVKGENAAVGVKARRLLGHRVAVLNPFAIQQLGADTDALNPLDHLRYGTTNFASDCKRLAGAVVEKSKAGAANPHFEESAVSLVAGAISFVYDANRRGLWPEIVAGDNSAPMAAIPASLPGVFDFFTCGADGLDRAFAAIETDNRKIGGRLARQAATTWQQIGADEKGSHYSTLMRYLGCFGDDGIRRCCDRSTINLDDLRSADAPLDIFICVPQSHIPQTKAFVRAIILAITAHVVDGERPPRDVLLLLDEMPALGPLDALMSPDGTGALALGRSAGLRIWAIVQSLSQLRATYGQEGFLTWVSSSSVVSFTKISDFDKETAEYISAVLGEFTVEIDDASHSQSGRALEQKSSSRGKSVRDAGRRLLRLEEVSKLPDDVIICMINDGGAVGKRPIMLHKLKYWERPEWAGRTDPNPFVRG